MQAYSTYFHQGSDSLKDFDATKLSQSLTKMREETTILQRELLNNHSMVNPLNTINDEEQKIRSQGYLFKRTTNAFKTWNRRWFMIQGNKLIYQRRSDNETTVMEEDLRLCNVKPVIDSERRFCFEIVSPSKSHILQADSEDACRNWISALQAGIDAAYNGSFSVEIATNRQPSSCESLGSSDSNSIGSSNATNVKSPPPRLTEARYQIYSLPGNEICADCRCGSAAWASLNLGITLCIECSGAHRSLGVHHSKVKSLNLDSWDGEHVRLMLALGNEHVNSIYEQLYDENIVKRPTSYSTPKDRETFIREKYVNRRFISRNFEKCDAVSNDNGDNDSHDENYLNQNLFKAIESVDLKEMSRAIGRGASINWQNLNDNGRYPIHKTVLIGSNIACEYLLLNGAKIDSQDANGQTALHLAAYHGNTGMTCLLLKRGANYCICDNEKRNALDVAMLNVNADIVTLLRIKKLNEDMRNDEYPMLDDDTFNEAVKDFSQLSIEVDANISTS